MDLRLSFIFRWILNWGDLNHSGLSALLGCLAGATILIGGIWVLVDMPHGWKRLGCWLTVSGGVLVLVSLMTMLMKSLSTY